MTVGLKDILCWIFSCLSFCIQNTWYVWCFTHCCQYIFWLIFVQIKWIFSMTERHIFLITKDISTWFHNIAVNSVHLSYFNLPITVIFGLHGPVVVDLEGRHLPMIAGPGGLQRGKTIVPTMIREADRCWDFPITGEGTDTSWRTREIVLELADLRRDFMRS